jgi:hypothetical protein
VQDLNGITINMQGSDDLDGTYDRLTGSLQSAVLGNDTDIAELSDIAPRGLYQGDDGLEIVFGNPEFTMRSASGERSGGYALYRLSGTTILELKYVDANRLPVESRRYAVEYSETTDDDRLIRRMLLTPGIVGISGFAPSTESTLSLEQIELLDEEESAGDQ